MIEWFSAAALVLAVTGNLLVNFKKRFGFIIWILSNIAWIVVNIIGPTNISQIIMYVIYMGLNIHGFIYWKKDKSKQT
jgi:nicotinamide riboside transporter PnuC